MSSRSIYLVALCLLALPLCADAPGVFAITGGTGSYSKARGEMDLVSRNGGTEFDFIFHLH